MVSEKIVNETPLVSIYIPTHNRCDLVNRAIMSVINQTYPNLEIIVCDDASVDNTAEVINFFSKKDPRVKVISNEIPMGACVARNRCIMMAKGEFITGLDDDDEFTPDRIEKFVSTYIKTKRNIITASRIYKNEKIAKVGDTFIGNITFDMMKNANWIGNQVFTKTSFLKGLGGFDVEFPSWQDYELWFRLVKNYGDALKLKDATYIFYIDEHRPRITSSSNSYKGYLLFYKKHNLDLSKENKKNLFFQDLINRRQEIKVRHLFSNYTTQNLKSYLKITLKKIKLLDRLHTNLKDKY